MRPHLSAALTLLIFGLFVVATGAQASDTLRVGSRVLTVGDSAARVTELLGKPSYKSHRSGSRGGSHGHRGRRAQVANDSTRGEQWQYRHNGHVIVVTIVDGRVSDLDERSR